jgi:F-type H+-transporting ATPase subunit b
MLNVDLSILVTVLYVIILYIFLSRFFFGPLTHVLQKRRELIEGRLEEARSRLEIVDQKTSEYEQTLRAAKAEAYHQQEIQRERALSEKAELVEKAKTQAGKVIEEGRARLQVQAEVARKKLEGDVETLAKKLTTVILRD